ncbi:hypothetical protein [Sorangium sp. So ce145]|uniref:hypothetical protein n=1 Tax=Sorangium sp. So ce145 TaxID=3133285 RepID=UPI003F645616
MAYQTKFVEATSAERLTEVVQEAEREGWEFMSASVGMTWAPGVPHREGLPAGHAQKCMLAVLRRPVERTGAEREAGQEPSDEPATDDGKPILAGKRRW